MSNTGKLFESQIARWLREGDYYFERFYDSRSVGGITSQRPADYFVYEKCSLYYIECKSTQGTSIPLANFYQLPRLLKLYRRGVVSYFICKFSTGIVAIEVLAFWLLLRTLKKKSVVVSDFMSDGIFLKGYKDLEKIL